MKKLLLFTVFVSALFSHVTAQDIMIKTNSDTIKCLISEIGTDEIHYKMQDYRSDLSFSVDKNLITKIILEGGKEINIEHSMYGSANYETQRKNALKINFLSPLYGSTIFTYERSLVPGKSIEYTLGIIGLGIDSYDIEGKGAFMKVGYKLIKSPDYYLRGMRYAHLLKGIYVRPELAMSIYSHKDYYWNYYDGGYGGNASSNYYTNENRKKDTNIMFAVLLNIGKQWVFNDQFIIDMYCGIGYGFGRNKFDNPFHYGFTGARDDAIFVGTAGLRIGILLRNANK